MKYSNLLYYFVKRSSCECVYLYGPVRVFGCVLVLHVNGPIKEKIETKIKKQTRVLMSLLSILNDKKKK